MLRKIRNRLESEKGFTLIELLVVILIIGILAAIALPAFLGQRAKGQDSSAKSNARNLVSQIESCYAQKQKYDDCDGATELGTTGLTYGPGPGEVSASASSPDAYVVTAKSESGNTFLITKAATGESTRSCSVTGGTDKGGCNGTTW